MPASSAPEPFGKYRLLSQIGEGGMGVVYRAEMDGPDGPMPVVVKRVRPELARDPSFSRMMAQEARLGALMRHPCVVPVIEAGEVTSAAGHELYLVLEYVDGYDLSQILDRAIRIGKQIPIGVACWLAMQAAEALDYAHKLVDERGQPLVIAHRDISPSNLMVTREGTLKLLDFGIAKAADHVQDERTRTGTMKGKFAYFSPEQAEGLALDARSDLFSLGVVLMELLLQRRLFRGKSDFDTLRRVRELEVPRPSSLRSEIDPELDRVLLRLLERRREARFPSAHDVVAALRPIVKGCAGSAEATRAYLASIAPIERRAMTLSPLSDAVELSGVQTQHVSLSVIDPSEVTASPRTPNKGRTRAAARRPPDERGAPSVKGLPRWKAYLDSLPDGVRSFPACTIKAAVVRNFSEFFGGVPAPRGAPKELHELIDHPPLVSSYVSGVLGRLYFLAVADALGVDDETFLDRVYASNVQLLASPLYKVMFRVRSTERLIRNVKSRWAAFHHGVELTVSEFGKDHARGALFMPAGFEPPLVLRMHATGLRAALEAVGAQAVHSTLTVESPTEARFDFRWTPA